MATQTVDALSVLMSAGTPVATVSSATTVTHSIPTSSSTLSSMTSSTASHSTPSATPSHITTHVEAAAAYRSNGLTGAEITGIGVGITFALIQLLIILIFLMRWHQRRHPQPMAASDYSAEKPQDAIGDETWVFQPKKSIRPSMVSPGTANPNPVTHPAAFKPEASMSSEDTPSSFSSESTYSQTGVAPLRSGAPPQRPQGPYVQPPAVARNESLRSPFDNRPRGSLRNPSRAGSNLR